MQLANSSIMRLALLYLDILYFYIMITMGSCFVTFEATSREEILHFICFGMARESTTAKGVHEILYVAGTLSFDLVYKYTEKPPLL